MLSTLPSPSPAACAALDNPGDPTAVFARLSQWPGAYWLDHQTRPAWDWPRLDIPNTCGPDSWMSAAPAVVLTWTRNSPNGRGGHLSVWPRQPAWLPPQLSPWEALRRIRPLLVDPASGITAPNAGYLAYELGHLLEPSVPRRPSGDSPLPDMYWAIYDTAIRWSRSAWLTTQPATDPYSLHSAVIEAHDPALWSALGMALPPPADRIAFWAQALATTPSFSDHHHGHRLVVNGRRNLASHDHTPAPVGELSPGDYARSVARVIDYIAAGDVFQVNLSQRFTAPLTVSEPDLFAHLRRLNEPPHAAYLALVEPLAHGDSPSVATGSPQLPWLEPSVPAAVVLSASPELFVHIDATGRVTTRPIKGTRPRHTDPHADADLAAQLLASPKDTAELVMIVDLLRNDLGRVCQYGSVRVEIPRHLESYPTVHHMVATVTGQLRPQHDALDLLMASFPGGSITGAPKVRAMQIIAELEASPRGVYTGAIGHFTAHGGLDLNIAIRTLTSHHGRVCFGVGGGIVADSDPWAEYLETQHKAAGLVTALAAAADNAVSHRQSALVDPCRETPCGNL